MNTNLFVFNLFLMIVLFPVSVFAQGHSAYCIKADSSAAQQSCLTRHLSEAQNRLQTVYKALQTNLSEEERKSLGALQESWLAYRDAECLWESERTHDVTAKRLNELSCMARITEDRADLLTIVHGADELSGMVREYGSFPRWMNVVSKDHPGIAWQYGERMTEDLNCDDVPEKIMTGYKTTATENSPLFQKEIVVAVAENPMIGRPKIKLFPFPVTGEDKEGVLCADSPMMTISTTEAQSDDACGQRLIVKQKSCSDQVIGWDGKQFAMMPFKRLQKPL